MKWQLLIGLCILLAACTQTSVQPTATGTEPALQPSQVDHADPYEFKGIQQWFNIGWLTNSTSLTKEDLRGKVVLVDFWTYSCINCLRTLPYLTSWDAKYRSDGLVIVGIHAPEFAFEHDPNNVAKAIAQYNISYPVGLDNDYATWTEYKNAYWPHSYLFDRNGNLVFDHIGEGGYDEVEAKIQELLAVKENMTQVQAPIFADIQSPEIYLAADTRGNIGYDVTQGQHDYSIPLQTDANTVYIGGSWAVNEQYIQAVHSSTLLLRFHAKDAHVVAGGSGTIAGTVDSSVLSPTTINGEQLYTLSSTDYNDHTLTLNVSPGVQLYTFTFG